MSIHPVSSSKQSAPHPSLASQHKTPVNSTSNSSISSSSSRSSGCLAFVKSIISKLQEGFISFLALFGIGERGALNRLINNPVKFLQLLCPSKGVVNLEKPDINMKNIEGKTILFLLCEREGDVLTVQSGTQLTITLDMIKRVIDKGARAIAADNGQNLMHVVKSATTAALLKPNLSDYEYELTSGDKRGQTPLHTASIAGRTELVAWMVNSRVHLGNFPLMPYDNEGSTPLHYAANIETARVFINYKYRNNSYRNSSSHNNLRELPFQKAIKDRRLDVAEFLVQEMVKDANTYFDLLFRIRVEELQTGKIGEIVLRHLPPLESKNGVDYRKRLAGKVEGVDRNSPFGKLLIAHGIEVPEKK